MFYSDDYSFDVNCLRLCQNVSKKMSFNGKTKRLKAGEEPVAETSCIYNKTDAINSITSNSFNVLNFFCYIPYNECSNLFRFVPI